MTSSMGAAPATVKSPWPRAIVAFFIILTLINIVILYLALSTRGDYLESSPYERGLKYEEIVEQKLAANRSGYQVVYQISPADTDGMREVRASFGSTPLPQDAEVTLKALRLADASLDQEFALARSATDFVARAKLPAVGLWMFRLTLKSAGKTLLFESRQILP